jgi:nitroimidazol reductase NimA-like FMN-containing flavoprotein (pyridoxamine 5'-phosphate oxidase superfamily)
MKLTKTEREFLDALRVARLATVDANGIPHNVPICPLLSDDKIYLATEAGAKKVKNIEANPNVALAFDEYTDVWSRICGVMIQGKARVVGPREFRQLRNKFYAKYQQYESVSPIGDTDSAILEITPERKFTWGL